MRALHWLAAGLLAAPTNSACEVSAWSDWGACEAVTCEPCDYGAATPGIWTRPPSSATGPPVAGAPRPADAEKMARKPRARRPRARDARARDARGRRAGVDGAAAGFACDGVDLVAFTGTSSIAYAEFTNDLWGWTSPAGVEYALVGASHGLAIFELGRQSAVATVTYGGRSYWRDVKVYNGHAFVVSEATAHGLAESATAYVVGGGPCAYGALAVDVRDPKSPEALGCVFNGYVHDAQCVVYRGGDDDYYGREICFFFTGAEIRVVDVTNVNRPTGVSSLVYDGVAFAHQGWLDCAQALLVVDDELDEFDDERTRTYFVDVSDLDAPVFVKTHYGATTAIDHNQYVCGAFSYQANYAAGLRILDVSRDEISEVASFDTHRDGDGTTWTGAWGAYPFFASGRVAVNDIDDGVAVVQPTALFARRRTRTVLSRGGGGDVCPLLADEVACDVGSAPPTPACHDSASWFSKKSTRDCAYVAERPGRRCDGREDAAGVPVAAACCAACCEDSASWYSKKPKQDCAWVASKASRCSKEDARDVSAEDACPAACGACAVDDVPSPTASPDCADSTSWFSKKSKRDCDYVAKKSKRCKLKDGSEIKARDACAMTLRDLPVRADRKCIISALTAASRSRRPPGPGARRR
ncbi:hypothetical protein JL722_3347 [Aureococcus anophagefferens]|nr:hypothetical protein JL722_3347 [Aureococcus anophagefferens]